MEKSPAKSKSRAICLKPYGHGKIIMISSYRYCTLVIHLIVIGAMQEMTRHSAYYNPMDCILFFQRILCGTERDSAARDLSQQRCKRKT